MVNNQAFNTDNFKQKKGDITTVEGLVRSSDPELAKAATDFLKNYKEENSLPKIDNKQIKSKNEIKGIRFF